MDSRVTEWRKSGILPSDVAGLSLAEREMFVTKDNVWGYELWQEWKSKGISGEDLYYIYKVKQILPEKVSRSRIEVQQGSLYYLYEDYVEQVYAIKMYLFEQAREGVLNYNTWLEDLYKKKGWAVEIESIYGNRVEYDGEAISWEEVVTPELEQFVNSFKYEGTHRAFKTEYYCQGFPERVSEGVNNPRVYMDESETGVVTVKIAVSDYTYKGSHESKGAFIKWLEAGGFTREYYKEKEEFLEKRYILPMESEKDEDVLEIGSNIQDSSKLCSIKRYRLTPNNVKVYRVEDKRGNSVEMSEGAVRDNIINGAIVVNGLDVDERGRLHWLRAPQLMR